MFNLITLLISFTHASYNQYGATTVTQPYNLPGLPYVLTKAQSYCKNHGSEMQGELSTSDTLVLKTPPAGGVLACAQSVMFHAQQNMCGDVFWANNNQCACLRMGVICKEERSESGFGIYQLTRLGSKHKHAKKCAKLQSQTECEKLSHCKWDADACSGISLSKEHIYPGTAGYPVGTPQLGVNPAALGARGYPQMGMNPQLGVGVGMNPAMNPAMLNTQLVPWRDGYDCEREIDEHTGLSNVIDLPLAAHVNLCVQYMQQNPQCNQQQFVFQKRVDGFPGECSCIRVNLYCDEENRPGWQLYDFTKGPNAMGGVAPTGQFPTAHGMPPATGVAGVRPGAYGAVPGAYGAVPGAYGALPGAVAGIRPGAYPATGATAATPGVPGAYPATPGYPATGAMGYPATGAYPATGMGYQTGMVHLSKSHDSATRPNKSFRSVVLFAVIPSAICLLTAAVLGFFYRRYQNIKDTDYSNYILDDSKTPSV